jgi:class 3 adenylate cyclase
VEAPRTRYVPLGELRIAYQVVGDGPIDLLYVPGGLSHLDLIWMDRTAARFLRRLASFSRLILYDRCGVGLSDPVDRPPTADERLDEARAVLDAVGSERAAILGYSEGGTTGILLAATDPERVSHLITYGSFITGFRDAEHPWGIPDELWGAFLDAVEHWGEGRTLGLFAPSLDSAEARARFGVFERAATSPLLWRRIGEANRRFDVSDVLEAVRVPTLAIHARGDLLPIENARELVRRVPDARLVELPGDSHIPWLADAERIASEIERFITGHVAAPPVDRALATVLFTDIVGSTRQAAELGDAAWRELLARHDALVRDEVESYGGRTVKSLGDGILATFDGPARAVRCAAALHDVVRPLGIELRAGLHTGECELVDGDVAGIAVHIGARVGALAGAGEVLVSGTVKDLVVGSGLDFEDHGRRALPGVPGEWQLFALAAAAPAPRGAPAPAPVAA